MLMIAVDLVEGAGFEAVEAKLRRERLPCSRHCRGRFWDRRAMANPSIGLTLFLCQSRQNLVFAYAVEGMRHTIELSDDLWGLAPGHS
ncbi:hypothetical protein CPY51_24175 [Rhizobium tubonense]|uniref:Uncharacterized protein n=1 Tax=Rhizobium tubonense TaxID=484088 RepID=A0A2W4CB81_9HYPH|nr:hypothetical protein CPY51_24175 [Rhizobium tubonense]